MIFQKTKMEGAWIVDLNRLEDERGFFARSFCQREFTEHGMDPNIAQCNVSYNRQKGTLRGMHLQISPSPEAKLVQCTQGAIYDVMIDLRPDSLTFCEHLGVLLSAENYRMLYIPEGFAHGFLTLEDHSTVFYLMSEFYAPDCARGFRWNDPAFNISWPDTPRVISERCRVPRFFNGIIRVEMSLPTAGQEIYQFIEELYPICRSITGDGFRQSLGIMAKHLPLEMHEVPSGTPVLDWTVPREWNIRDAYIRNAAGERIVDFQKSNLHVLNYSVPVNEKMRLDELKPHLFSLPDYPDWIPYRTSYYKENWGFCVSHNLLGSMGEDEYEVVIDSSLEEGHLTYGEYLVRGESKDEFLISCHCCHPSLCNDNLSGMGLAVQLAKTLSQRKMRYSYRFLFIPGTIGSITWLARNRDTVSNIKHGLVVACVGDRGKLHYKKSRHGDREIDRAALHVLAHSGQEFGVIDFFPYGYDERQYSSPGFDLEVGCLSRTPHGKFPQYHTSADNLDFISAECLNDTYEKYIEIIDVIDGNKVYTNTHPYGEPQLGRRGLYASFGGRKDSSDREMATLWILNLSDGQHSLLDIAERSGMSFSLIRECADALIGTELLIETLL